MAGSRRQQPQQQQMPTTGKVSIANLVSSGLLVAGNTILCNSWPFSAVVTSAGTFTASWQPLPSDFVAGHGTEFMKAEFETPSAWATAVCRVMRAQQRAQKNNAEDGARGGGGGGGRGKHLPSTGGSGESRVAVNGWTACRVRVPRSDPNRRLALRLDAEARDAAGSNGSSGSFSDADDVLGDIEVPLDALRRELCSRVAARARRLSSEGAAEAREDAHDRLVAGDEAAGSGSECEATAAVAVANGGSPGAVDGLARRVETGLALGCVKQRRAAAAAADAISAAANGPAVSAMAKLASQQPALPDQSQQRRQQQHGHGHSRSRKRKSIPDMSRQAKLSRVPTENSSEPEPEPEASDGAMSLADGDSGGMRRGPAGPAVDARVGEQLERFRERARALQRPQAEAKALRYQRRQRLKRAIAGALDTWMHRRRQGRADEVRCAAAMLGSLAIATRPPSPQPPPPPPQLSPGLGSVIPAPLADGPLVGGMRPAASDVRQACWPSEQGGSSALASASIVAPLGVLRHRAPALTDLCTLCASTGASLQACAACGDKYHGFCVPAPQQPGCSRFLCPDCRLCAVCLSGQFADELLQCDGCGLLTHEQCSGQTTAHAGGLVGLVAENAGRWLCDRCVVCHECGFRMPLSRARTIANEADELRVQWAYDFSLCGTCAPQIEKAKVCPECLATYANARMGTSMVCCDVCAFWIHTDCDPCLTPAVYDALLTLEDDAPYVCPVCARMDPAAPAPPSSAAGGGGKGPLAQAALSQRASSLPLCLRSVDAHADPRAGALAEQSGGGATGVGAKLETEEIANMLLSLTHSDVRFGRERFDVAALEARFCVPGDWRTCALCGLRGDGAADRQRQRQQQLPALGRLVPLSSGPSLPAAFGGGGGGGSSHWVHVECLAWAWGPRPVGIPGPASSHPLVVRFEGMLLDRETTPDLSCALCGRPGASFHCCAPVACADAAYHLPCMLVAGSSPTPAEALAPGEPQYCAEWRRALCHLHAPVFSAMMPAGGSVEAPVYDSVRVQGVISNLPSITAAAATAATDDDGADETASALVRVTGNLVQLGEGLSSDKQPVARYVRFFSVAGAAYSLHLCRDSEPALWRACVCPGFSVPEEMPAVADMLADECLADLLSHVLRLALPPASTSAHFLAALASVAPLRFLKLPLLLADDDMLLGE
ncbi:hypothetical protein LPJ53_003985 [Coemansia erecta]|uniref:PHD-type domain-containing protein n=1 Tax=Coemansia erecta TaxID=147472 RepID=A0A9W7XV78_9FUNG|nr:hypothetical protein LPJ53_003985 [Coemansia erecta]